MRALEEGKSAFGLAGDWQFVQSLFMIIICKC